MERLTKRLSSGVVSWNYSNDCYGEDETRNKVFKSVHRQNACEKLAAIEDILGDEYDLDRLRELAEADREGRCVVLPIKIPGWGWYCNDKFPNAISAYFDCPSQVVDCMEDYVLRETKEEAEAALAKLNSGT